MGKKFSAIKGTHSHHKQIIKSESDFSIAGNYMNITFEQLFCNIMLTSLYSNRTKLFTAAILLFENIWDYRLRMFLFDNPLMIDSASFQHERLYDLSEYNKVQKLQYGGFIENAFPVHQDILEDHSKTRGTFLFDKLPDKILPQRFIFMLKVYEPGQVEGTDLDTETFEFIFPNEKSIKLIRSQGFGAADDASSRIALNASTVDSSPTEHRKELLSIVCLKKSYHEPSCQGTDVQHRINFVFRFTNNYKKDLRAFAGNVHIRDLFDDLVMIISLKVEDPIKSKGTLIWEGGIKYDYFQEGHVRLNNLALKDMKVEFEPKSVIFSDGTKQDYSVG